MKGSHNPAYVSDGHHARHGHSSSSVDVAVSRSQTSSGMTDVKPNGLTGRAKIAIILAIIALVVILLVVIIVLAVVLTQDNKKKDKCGEYVLKRSK